MRFTIIKLQASLLLFGVFSSCPAWSADGSASPGAILQYQTKPWTVPGLEQPQTVEPAQQAPVRDPVLKTQPVENKPENQPSAPADELKVRINHIELQNSTLLSAKQSREAIAPFEGKDLTFHEMETLAQQLTNLYIKAGYLNSQVYIPAQDFSKETLLLSAQETVVNTVIYEPIRWFPSHSILPQVDLKSGEPFNVKPLDRSIHILNNNPDLTIRARLEKGNTSGTTNVILSGQSHFPLHITPFWDNLGRDSIGNFRYGATLSDNNLLGLGDRENASFNLSRRSFGVINQYSIPVGRYGTQLGFDYAYSNVRLGGDVEALKIQSRAHIFTPSIHQPLWQNDRFGVNTYLAFDFLNLNTDILGLPLFRDRLRILRPGMDAYLNDRWGRTYLNQEVGMGLDILGGSVGNTALSSKPGSGTKFVRISGGLTRVQKLPWSTTGILRARYQYSPNRLVSAEQFQAGGAFTVRGYTEGQVIGDSGYVLNAEWYIPFLPKKLHLPYSKQSLRQTVQLVTFADWGQLFTNRAISTETTRNNLLSCGAGLRIQLTRFLVARLDLGIPLLQTQDEARKPRLHFGLQSGLF